MKTAGQCPVWSLLLVLIFSGQAVAAQGQFAGDVVAKWMPDGRAMQLTEPLTYIDARGERWIAPKGAVVDGASIPRSLWSIVGAPFSGKYRKSSVIHDYFCQVMSRPWRDVHKVFFEASVVEGTSLYHAKLMYGAVYAWGPRWEIVDGSPKRTRDTIKPPTEDEFRELAEWIKGDDPSLGDIASFIDKRFQRVASEHEKQKRMALIVGNSNYAHTRILPNARNDAEAMTGFLKGIGFQVTGWHDTNYQELRRVVREFGTAAAGADVAIVYFAGHGLEVAGQNYLLPVDAKLATSADLEYEAITLASVLDVVRARRKLNLVIVDACRNNPLAEKMTLREGARRSVQRGLARVEPHGDLLVAFAANAGTVAQDGTGLNSPFVEALIDHLGRPGLDIRLALGGVRDAVLAATGNGQEPVIYGALGGQVISLVAAGEKAIAFEANARVREQDARVAWDAVKDSCKREDLKLFSGRYKDTFFGDLATRRLSEIEEKTICVEQRADPAPDKQLARSLQAELKRLGCFSGPVNGNWGPRTTAGFKLYAQHAKLPDGPSAPTEAVLAEMKRVQGRLCPAAAVTAVPAPEQSARGGPPADKSVPVPKIVTRDCASVRSACGQLRTQCLRLCHQKIGDQTYGNCDSCVSSFSMCLSQASSGACR
jgi:hypothetical protein